MLSTTNIGSILRALADPTRRAVFEQVVQAGELTVGALTERNGVSQPAISQHVRALKEAGLLLERREGRQVHYRGEPRGLTPLADWLGFYGAFWRDRFDGLKSLLKEMDDDQSGIPADGPRRPRHRRRRGPAASS